MTPAEFEAKIKSIPAEEPDELDLAMIAEAEAINDGTTISLEDLKKELDGCSGKLVLRLPRSLHRSLKEAAKLEGVSLNQYIVYKLSS
jgi:hypothetical protein